MRVTLSFLLVAAFTMLPGDGFCINAVVGMPDRICYSMEQGWYADAPAWWIAQGASTNDVDIAYMGMFLAPKLSSALDGTDPAARPMYYIMNYNQGMVFGASPGDPYYSGFWQVHYLTWKPGFARPITNADPASALNPTGIPPAAEAEVVVSNAVVQMPIVALGKLDGPWLPAPAGTYRMRQVMVKPDYIYTKEVYLPIRAMFCKHPVTRQVGVVPTVIPDVGDAELAEELGANLAPGLLNVPLSDTQKVWRTMGPQPPGQMPILEEIPTGWGAWNTNFEYSPVLQVIVLERNIPYYVVVNNPDFVEYLIGSGALVITRDDQRVGILFGGMPYSNASGGQVPR